MRCAVFRDLWGTRGQPGQGNEEQIFVHEQRFWCVRVIIVQNGIKIYINKEKIPLDLSLSLSLSLVAVVVSRRAFSLSLVVHFWSVKCLLLSCVQFFVSFSG